MSLSLEKKKLKKFKKSSELPRKTHRKVLTVFTVIFSIYSLMLVFPMLWVFLNSFKNGYSEFVENSWGLPKKIMISNYAEIFKLDDFNLLEMFKNTIILCLGVPTIGCISTTFTAYVLAKYKFKGSKILYFCHILPMLVSIAGTSSSLYLLMDSWNLIGTFSGIFIMSATGTGLNFLLLYAQFKNISDAYKEAAQIDGAGHYQIFFRIMLPQAIGLIGTIWMLGFIGTWNDYGTAKIFLGVEHYTIGTGLEKIGELVESGDTFFMNNYPAYFAAIILTVIPVVGIFLGFQKQIMSLSLGGGIKG